MVTAYIDGEGEMRIIEKQTTWSVWWYTCHQQKMPSRATVYSVTDANDLRVALEGKGWQAWWTQDEED